MEKKSHKFKIKLGLFVAVGTFLFIFVIFIIGRQRNLFDPVFNLSAEFYNVSGLQVGNNVRFSGINVGTVENIQIVDDTTVQVDMQIRKNVRKFIKSDSRALIGSEGLIGDRLVIISQGSPGAALAEDGEFLSSNEPVETDEILASLEVTAGNAEIISDQLAEIMLKINSGTGTIGRLIQDTTIAENLDKTITNLKEGTKGLEENMEAAKHNFLLRGYFKKKAREAKKEKKEKEKEKEEKE